MGRKTGRNQKRGWKLIGALLALWFAAGVLQNGEALVVSVAEHIGLKTCAHSMPRAAEWNLLVVNRWNPIPEEYTVTLTELANGQRIDSRIDPALQEMFDAAREEGVYLVVREGYRTTQQQEAILREKVQAYQREGYSQKRAEKIAREWVALPGTSEHQLGIAVDINADKEKSTNEEAYEWLAQNAYRYGFILRYPQGKTLVTGTAYEPWHYRYVGVEEAQLIYERQICLEEFIKSRETEGSGEDFGLP